MDKEGPGTSLGLHLCECKVKLCINPAYLGDPMAGVYEQLSRMLLKYSSQLQGVPLAFKSVKLASKGGVIRHDEPYVHLRVTMSVLVFTPAPEQQFGALAHSHIARSDVFLSTRSSCSYGRGNCYQTRLGSHRPPRARRIQCFHPKSG